MNTALQTINNETGRPEYVLLPISIYMVLKVRIDKTVSQYALQNDYSDFNPSDYISNKIALARMRANITQTALAKALHVSQAYISKIENDNFIVPDKLFLKVNSAINKLCLPTKRHAKIR